MNLELFRKIVRYAINGGAVVLGLILWLTTGEAPDESATFIELAGPAAVAALTAAYGVINIALSVARQIGLIIGPPTPPAPPADPS